MSRPLIEIQGELFDIPPEGPNVAMTAADDPMPPGPYALSLVYDHDLESYVIPYRVVGSNGKTVAGWIASLEIAKTVRDALNDAVSP